MRIAFVWLRGLLTSVSGRIAGAVLGVALTIALLAAVGSFTATSAASMTRQAIANVSVDWQIQVNHGASLAMVRKAVASAAAFTALQEVSYANVPGFELTAGGTTQATGAGKVVGISAQYHSAFPLEVRSLLGASQGALLAQQTAANLHARVGDRITVKRDALPLVQVRIDGIVDMPNADAFFQAVGLPAGAAPQAPPDNVLILPARDWHAIFDPQTNIRPDSTHTQLHVRVSHDLPADPLAAYQSVDGAAKHLEALVAGSAAVGDNLAATLLGTQADALYARVLFLFLGVPGVMLGILLTLGVTASGQARRRREQALLRIRGASTPQILWLAAIESLTVAIGGMILGVALFQLVDANAHHGSLGWLVGACATGCALALAGVLVPAFVQARAQTVSAARAVIGKDQAPLWQRLYLDVALLIVAALAYWQTAATGFQIVLAPEGVPQSSVHYQAFLGPVFFWLGAALFSMRLMRGLLLAGRTAVSTLVRPLAHSMAQPVAASLARQHRLITRGAVLVMLAASFGTATAVFNATYNAQSLVDAQLTNGADVTVSGQTAYAPSRYLALLRAIPGVIAAEPMQHRFAYVGNDLQDLYGIDSARIANATPMSNAFFGNADAKAALAMLGKQRDGILVSEETVTTYQLHLGDPLILRLPNAHRRFVPVPFHFLGISREFPTAPHDSFLIANASYVAQQTGSSAAEIVLMRASAGNVQAVARRASRTVETLPGAHVTTIFDAQHSVGSTLTAVDLRGLTAIELSFAVIFIAAATGLVLALSLAERRRTFAILSAIGAKPRQLGAFLWSEASIVVIPGTIFGLALGIAIAHMLVRVLTGVFDPPPESLVLPWPYLTLLLAAAGASTVVTVLTSLAAVQRSVVIQLRRL